MNIYHFTETEKALNDLEKFLRGGHIFEGIKTGFETIDDKTGGLANGNLILLGGRPGMGKTSFALRLIENVTVASKNTTVYFSLGQSKLNVFQKILEQMIGKKLLIEDDKSFASVTAIKSRCNEIQTKTGIRLLIIDYLQLMNGEADDVCRELKGLAMKLECPVLLMTQLGRECEYRADHRPMLSDLPGDVRLESLANEILLLYRDDYYDMHSDVRGKVEIEVAKHPAAPRYTIYFNWSDIRQMYTRDHIVRENSIKYINFYRQAENITERIVLSLGNDPITKQRYDQFCRSYDRVSIAWYGERHMLSFDMLGPYDEGNYNVSLRSAVGKMQSFACSLTVCYSRKI